MDVLHFLEAAGEILPFAIMVGPLVFLEVYCLLGWILTCRARPAVTRLLIPGDPEFYRKLAVFKRDYARYCYLPFGPALWLGWIKDDDEPQGKL